MKNFYDAIANKSSSFCAAVSSNPNESINASICSKAPKSRIYGTSASYDFRVACAVNKKNDGEEYIVNLAKKLQLSPGKHTQNYCNLLDNREKKRYSRSTEPSFKRRRLFLKKKKLN